LETALFAEPAGMRRIFAVLQPVACAMVATMHEPTAAMTAAFDRADPGARAAKSQERRRPS
jgi:hypothetical protein